MWPVENSIWGSTDPKLNANFQGIQLQTKKLQKLLATSSELESVPAAPAS